MRDTITMRGTNVEETVQFAGLTSHNNMQMTQRAARIAGMDADDPPDSSFMESVRELETADTGGLCWEVPEKAAERMDVEEFNRESPDDIELVVSTGGDLFVRTTRFQSVFSPDKLRQWMSGEYHDTDDDGNKQDFRDALWHVPTSNYSISNPVPFYEPLAEEVRDEDLGDSMFGEIRTYKSGGEVHMNIMFDAFEVAVDEDAGEFDGPVVLGIETGYDFFGNNALYAQGYAQDTGCSNSIRAVTDKKSRRHVGEIEDTNEWWADILEQMDLMTDHLADAIEAAQEIELDYLDMNFSEAFEHDDDLRAFYELSGFPSYLANAAASNVQSRAENSFLPNMWELHSGATYALTHEYRGTENSSRMNELTQVANDMLFNPTASIGTVDRVYSNRLSMQSEEGEQSTLEGQKASAVVSSFRESIEDQREQFETRQEELQTILTQTGEDTEEGVEAQ